VTPPAPREFFQKGDVKGVPYSVFYERYAKDLRFDPVYGAADSQHVDFRTGQIGRGGLAVIEPEEGVYALDSNTLAQGRVIARIKSDSSFARLGYGPRSWTYWWVDKRGPDGKGKEWRSLFFSERLKEAAEDNLRHHSYPSHVWRQSIARWKGSQWGSCDRVSCCIRE